MRNERYAHTVCDLVATSFCVPKQTMFAALPQNEVVPLGHKHNKKRTFVQRCVFCWCR